MGDFTWIAMFKPKNPGDKEWVDGMVALYGPTQDRIGKPVKTDSLFMKGEELRNARCVNQMHYCYEQGLGVPIDVNKWFDWLAKARVLEHGEPGWREWPWNDEMKSSECHVDRL